jgi:hypothetical protein
MVRLPPCLKLTLRATMAVSPTTPESLRRGSTLASKPMLAGGDTFSDCGRGNMKMCTLYLSVNGSVPLPLPPRAVRRQEWTQEIHDQSESLFLSRLLGMSPTPQINEALQLAEVGSVYTRLVSATKTVGSDVSDSPRRAFVFAPDLGVDVLDVSPAGNVP